MYRWLLRLYPASFRNEYGREMASVFARERRDTRTALGMTALWLRAIADTCVNAACIHWDILTQDLRYTLRTLRRTPAFALTAIIVVALGIGATAAAFSLADFVLIRPLPFPEADRLVLVSEQRPGFPRTELAPANYRDLKQMATSFEPLGAYRGLSVNLVGARQPLRLQGAAMTVDVLAALAVRPMMGRPFTAADDADGAPATALVSYALWQQEFGGDASIVGRSVHLDGEVYTVIGVMPRDFNFPSRGAQLWTAMRFVPADFVDRHNNYLQGIARLRRDISVDAARTEMSMLAGRLQQQYPKENEQTGASVIRLRDGVSRQSRTLLVTLFGAAACVLLIACANLTNLLLARAIDRRREMAVRIALGAGRERVLRQLLTESLVVTAAGGVLGLALASATVPILSRLVPIALPIPEIPSMDVRVVAFTMALTMVTGVAFGIVPLLQHHRDGASEGLREGARSGGSGREGDARRSGCRRDHRVGRPARDVRPSAPCLVDDSGDRSRVQTRAHPDRAHVVADAEVRNKRRANRLLRWRAVGDSRAAGRVERRVCQLPAAQRHARRPLPGGDQRPRRGPPRGQRGVSPLRDARLLPDARHTHPAGS
jgi:hypothetical protein